MKKKLHIQSWLIANLALLSVSLLMTWFILGFEPPPALQPIAGWEFILTRIVTSIELSLEYGLSWLWLLSFLQGVSGMFVVGYVVFRIISIIANHKFQVRSKTLSIILIAAMTFFLLSDFGSGAARFPWPGYWLFMLGILSSAVFEWRNSITDKGVI